MRSMFDIGRVEVLRGPQGTLRGRASPSGSITMTSRRPSLEGLTGNADVTTTDQGGENYNAAISFPLIREKLGIRVAGFAEENRVNHVKSFRTGDRAKMESDGYRASFPPEESESLEFGWKSVSLDGSYQVTDRLNVSGNYSWAQGTQEGGIACNVSQRSYEGPTWSASLRAEYSQPVFNDLEGYVRLQFKINGDQKGSEQSPFDDVSSYATLNFYTGLRSGETDWGRWEIMAFVKNVTDTPKRLSYGTFPVTTSIRTFTGTENIQSTYRSVSLTPPREVGLNVRFDF